MILPFEKITLESKLDSAELLERISQVVEPEKTFRTSSLFSSKNHLPYEGEFDESSFRLSKINSYRNDASPVIYGEIKKTKNGSQIVVQMRLRAVVIVFLCVFLVVIAILGLSTSLASETSTLDPDRIINSLRYILPFGGSLLAIVLFHFESSKSIKYLCDLLEAEVEL